ncbi:hypothetical protein D3C87_1806260 [compost metagenome]
MFWSLNKIPNTTATIPIPTEAIRDTRRSSRASALPFLTTITYRSWEIAEVPAMVRPDTTARIVANATAEMKPSSKSPPTALARCITGMLPPPMSFPPTTPDS